MSVFEPTVLLDRSVHDDPDHDFTVVIPTIGRSEQVPIAFRSLLRNVPERTRIVLVFNPKDESDARVTLATIQAMPVPDGVTVESVWFDRPVGFGGAFNAGVAHALAHGGLGRTVVCYNDDLRATPGWLESLDATLHDPEYAYVNLTSEGAPAKDGVFEMRRKVDRSDYGRLGIVGPVTTVAAGIQGIIRPEVVRKAGGHSDFAEDWRAQQAPEILTEQFLSGYCMAFARACVADLLVECPIAGFGPFDSARYPIAGWEDNDICIRARLLGWRLGVDFANYIGHVGHTSFDADFPEMRRGMRNRLSHYRKWEDYTQKADQRIVGVYRVRIGSIQDLALLRTSLARHASILDGVAILLTNSPMRDMPHYPDWGSHTNLPAPEQDLLAALQRTVYRKAREVPHESTCESGKAEGCSCSVRDYILDWRKGDDVEKIGKLLHAWVAGVLRGAPGTRFEKVGPGNLRVHVWTGDFNERDERNESIDLAYKLRPDWLFSIDHDEAVEDRIRRQHFDRLITHPDPGVSAWDLAWLDHWNDSRHFRTDPPWGDGGRYTGARHGRRLWRADLDDRIHLGTENGLHCGNVPDTGPSANRVSGIRFRHFGYLRQIDRLERFKRYQKLDPNPNPALVGGTTYGHIVSAEGMRMEFFNPTNGIGLHMLVYSKTDPDMVAGLLDQLYGLVDHIVLVWTDDESPETAMPEALSEYARLYKADVLHARLRDEHGVDFAAVRNAAIDHLADLNEKHRLGLGWGLFFDPDEAGVDIGAAVAIRRMAESSETYGWMFQFVNPLRTGQSTPSDSIRLHRLEPVMRMKNRVHESFDEATRLISKSGGTPAVRICHALRFVNSGLSDPDSINAKLRMYAQGLIAQIEEDPYSGGAWFSLGLQLEAEGQIEQAQACYSICCQVLPESFIGFRGMMHLKLREALAFASEAVDRLSDQHPWHNIGEKIVSFLETAAASPDNPATERVFDGVTLPAPPIELSHFAPVLGTEPRVPPVQDPPGDVETPPAVSEDPEEPGAVSEPHSAPQAGPPPAR